MITDKAPSTWEELQTKVGTILQQCGFATEVEAKLAGVRGTVELDVYAKEIVDGREYSIACECKYWKSNIPQHVIHSFRTIINDLGLNHGYIITTSKFQKGSIAAVEKTNIELLTWEQFQSKFFKSWYVNYFCKVLQNDLTLKIDYHWVDWFDELTTNDRSIYFSLRSKLHEIDEVVSHFPHPIFQQMGLTFETPKLPLNKNLFDEEYYYGQLPEDILNEKSFDELIQKLVAYSKPIMNEFEELHNKYTIQS